MSAANAGVRLAAAIALAVARVGSNLMPLSPVHQPNAKPRGPLSHDGNPLALLSLVIDALSALGLVIDALSAPPTCPVRSTIKRGETTTSHPVGGIATRRMSSLYDG